MKSKYVKLLISMLFCIALINNANSQPTSPVPYDLSNGTYKFLSWDSSSTINSVGTYPPNMIFHQSSKQDPQLEDEMDSDWNCPYNLDSRSRINGLGDNGIGFINTGQSQEDSVCSDAGYAGEIILALRTVNYKNINVTWKAGFVSVTGISNRQYCIRFQYRLGNSGDFIDLYDSSGNPVEYNYSGYLNDESHSPHEQLFSVILPPDADSRILVQLRWKYYYLANDNSNGSRPKMKVDDIIVSGDVINSIKLDPPCDNGIIRVIPNPADNSIVLSYFSITDGIADLYITDIIGNKIISLENYKIKAGENSIEIDLSCPTLESGVYLVCAKSTWGIESRKFILIK